MNWPRPQITIRGAILATLWMAVAFGINAAHARYARVPSKMPFEVPLTWIMMISPFLAVGALFNHIVIGAFVGFAAVSLFWLVWSMT